MHRGHPPAQCVLSRGLKHDKSDDVCRRYRSVGAFEYKADFFQAASPIYVRFMQTNTIAIMKAGSPYSFESQIVDITASVRST
jgi:hypothetical protein